MEPAVTVVEREKARYAPPPVRDSERSEAGQRRALRLIGGAGPVDLRVDNGNIVQKNMPSWWADTCRRRHPQ